MDETPSPAPRREGSREPLADLLARLDREVVESWGTSTEAAQSAQSVASLAPRTALEGASRYVLFDLGETRYAAPIEGVSETGDVPRSTAVPNVPSWIRGVTNLRGEILALVDLRAQFGLPRRDRESSARLVVVHSNSVGGSTSTSGNISVGWIVDAIRGLAVIADSELVATLPTQPTLPSAAADESLAGFLAGVCRREGRLVAVLDLNRWFAAPEVRRLTLASLPSAEPRLGDTSR